MSYSSIEWLPLAAGLTILGLLLSYLAYRRSGVRPALRGAALSLLPIAAYLTGALEMFWKIGAAIGQFGTGFVFSTSKWVGIGVTGLAIALFLAAGGRERRKASRQARKEARAQRKAAGLDAPGHDAPGPALGASTRPGTDVTRAMTPARTPVPATSQAAAKPAKASRKAQPVDDDLHDIEDILRKRGI
jgi:hypothetical protein